MQTLITITLLIFFVMSTSFGTEPCRIGSCQKSIILRTCEEVNKVACKDVPLANRRNCKESDRESGVELWNRVNACLDWALDGVSSLAKSVKSAASTLLNSTTESRRAKSAEFLTELYDVSSILMAELIKDPYAFLKGIYEQIEEAVASEISEYGCLNTENRAKKVCAYITTITATVGPTAFSLYKNREALLAFISSASKNKIKESAKSVNAKEAESLLKDHRSLIDELFSKGVDEQSMIYLLSLRKSFPDQKEFEAVVRRMSVCKLK